MVQALLLKVTYGCYQNNFFSINTESKKNFIKIFFLILVMQILETFGIALVIPAVKVLVSDSFYLNINEFFSKFIEVSFDRSQVIIYGLIFILLYFIFKFLFAIYTIYNQLNFNYGVLVSSSKLLYDGYLNQDYEQYTHQNSSLLVRNVTNLIDKFCALLENCFTILTDLTLFVAVVSLLFYIDFLGTSIILEYFL